MDVDEDDSNGGMKIDWTLFDINDFDCNQLMEVDVVSSFPMNNNSPSKLQDLSNCHVKFDDETSIDEAPPSKIRKLNFEESVASEIEDTNIPTATPTSESILVSSGETSLKKSVSKKKKEYELGEKDVKKCSICPFLYKFDRQIKLHRAEIHPGIEFAKGKAGKKKKEYVLGQKGVKKCTLCHYSYRFDRQIKLHRAEIHPGIEFAKEKVGRKKKEREARVAEKSNVYLCADCPAKFRCEISLINHKRHHDGLYDMKCEKCSFGCEYKRVMKYHVRFHHAQMPRRRAKKFSHHGSCSDGCTCLLPLLRLSHKRRIGCVYKNVKGRMNASVPEIKNNVSQEDATLHSIFLIGGCLGGEPVVLPDHHSAAVPVTTASNNSVDGCRSNIQGEMKEAVMFPDTPREIYQVPAHEANFVTKRLRNCILDQHPELSIAHNVCGGTSLWDKNTQDKVLVPVLKFVEDLKQTEYFQQAREYQLEKIAMNPSYVRPNIGKAFASTVCTYCNKNLQFRGSLMQHIANHKNRALNYLNRVCSNNDVKPIFKIISKGGRLRQLVLKVGDHTFSESVVDLDRSYVHLCDAAVLKITGEPLNLSKKT